MTSSFRIGVDARSLLCRHPRGEGKSLLRLYTEMLRIEPKLQVIFFGDENSTRFSGNLPAEILVVKSSIPGQRWNSWENVVLPCLCLWHRCDVLHAASSGAPRRCITPVVLTVHDLIPVLFDDGQSSKQRKDFAKRLDNGLGIARRIIAVSDHTRSDLLRWRPDIDTGIDVIHWGADDFSSEAPVPARRTQTRYIVGFAGEAARKNTDFTIDAFARIAPGFPELQLVLIGVSAPWQREHLAKRLGVLGLADRVLIPGFVSESELQSFVEEALLVLYPSLYEGFGLPVLEAIGRGVPVVASDRSSIPELLAGVPGALPLDLLVFEQTLSRLVSDPQWREQWAIAQRGVLSRFSWTACAERTLAALSSAVGSSS
jgi:glycosyltransferase involved in cell wall biosynthesis